jgi:hypothetical protein
MDYLSDGVYPVNERLARWLMNWLQPWLLLVSDWMFCSEAVVLDTV